MKLLNLLKKNALPIVILLALIGIVLYMQYKPEGFQENMPNLAGMPKNAPPPSAGQLPQGGRR